MSQPGAALAGTGHIANGLTVRVGLGAPGLPGFSLENPMGRGAWQAKVHGVLRVGYDRGDLAFTRAAQHSA